MTNLIKQKNNILGADMSFETCPHCRAKQAWYEQESVRVLTLKCVCGYLRVVYEETATGITMHTIPRTKVMLPEKGTTLSAYLGSIAVQYPDSVTTGFIAKGMIEKSSLTASKMMVLQHKGLIEIVESAKGKVGGSTWRLTTIAIKLLNLS